MTRTRAAAATVAVVAALTTLVVLVGAGVLVGLSGMRRLRDSQDGLPHEPAGDCLDATGERTDVEVCREQPWLVDGWLPIASLAALVAVVAVVVVVAASRRGSREAAEQLDARTPDRTAQ